MPHWLIKSAAQRLITCLPGGDYLSTSARLLTGSLRINDVFLDKRLRTCRTHLDHWRREAPRLPPLKGVVEIGTGAFPVVPLAMFLCGAERVWTFDIVSWMNAERIQSAALGLVQAHDEGRSAEILPWILPDRVERVRELADSPRHEAPQRLRDLQIRAVVQDVCTADLPLGEFNIAISFEVLEYIPREVLRQMFTTFHGLLAPGGVLSHHIDLRDEYSYYSYFDRRLSPLNFLRYSERTWQWLSPARYRHQRLRCSDFTALFEETGFTIDSEDSLDARPEDLDRVPLAAEFQSYSRADLLKLTSWICASPRRSAS